MPKILKKSPKLINPIQKKMFLFIFLLVLCLSISIFYISLSSLNISRKLQVKVTIFQKNKDLFVRSQKK